MPVNGSSNCSQNTLQLLSMNKSAFGVEAHCPSLMVKETEGVGLSDGLS